MNEQALFMLLRLGLGTTSVQKESISDLLAVNAQQWEDLEECARVQGISAIVYDGLNVAIKTLGAENFDHFEDKYFWSGFINHWAIDIVKNSYEALNFQQMLVIDVIQQRWSEAGIRMMLMKGTAMATYYPIPKHRCPGDIDCYLFDDYALGNELAKGWADRVNEDWYKHSQIRYGGQLIENHQYFVHTRDGKNSKRLNQLLCDTLKGVDLETFPGTGALLPPPMFNALFLTYHALTHFLEEGLRLKQIVDWAMFLKRDADKIDWPEFYIQCDKYHLRRFAEIATDFAVHYLGVELTDPQIVSSNPYTAKVVQSTLYDKDYVFCSGENGWSNRWHIVRNLIKYRWKYHKIYQQSVLKQLWHFASGFVLKTQ